jgi:hypothetical protein
MVLAAAVIFATYNSLFRSGFREGGVIAFVGLLQIWDIFSVSLQRDSMVDLVALVFRKFPQQILIYILVFHLAKWLSLLVTKRAVLKHS